jgi:hypothetical protein
MSAPECEARADLVRELAQSLAPHASIPSLDVLAWRLSWDAPAAGEYPRAMLADGRAVDALAPDLSARAWHAIAGATILGRYCCGTPASHRDALGDIAREVRARAQYRVSLDKLDARRERVAR